MAVEKLRGCEESRKKSSGEILTVRPQCILTCSTYPEVTPGEQSQLEKGPPFLKYIINC